MAKAELLIDIQRRLAKGEPEEHIRESLQKEHWSPEDINGAFAIVHLQQSPHRIESAQPWQTKTKRPRKSSVLFELIVLIIFLSAAPAAYGLLGPVIQTVIAQVEGKTATSTSVVSSNLFGIVPLIPIGIGLPMPATPTNTAPHTETTNAPSTGILSSRTETNTTVTTQTSSITVANDPTPTLAPPASPEPPVVTTPTPIPDTAPAPSAPIVIPSAPSGTYPVYPSCPAPPTTYSHTIYIDPVNGSDAGDGTAINPYKTLATVITNEQIPPDSHVILLPGDHGSVWADGSHYPAFVNPTGWVWFDFQPGAYVTDLTFRSLSNFLITNATFTYPAGGKTFIVFGAGHNMVLADSQLYTSPDSSDWNVAQWINADSAISSDDSQCFSIVRNHFTNIRGGIAVSKRNPTPNPSDNSLKILIQDNIIKNHSSDGMDVVGSDITVYHNAIIDDYVNGADGDANHDDGIQGFALNGAVYGNVVIDHNWVQETTDPSRKFNADEQGISSFDGVYTNLKVTNNVVLTSAYHGISWYGVTNALIDHNTVVDTIPGVGAGWIYVPVGKDGVDVPSNVMVSNNTAASVMGTTTGVTYQNNVIFKNPADVFTTFDPADNQFDFTPKPGSILDGTGAGVPSDMYSVSQVVAINSVGNPSSNLAIALKKQNASTVLVASVSTAVQQDTRWYVKAWHNLIAAIVALFIYLCHLF